MLRLAPWISRSGILIAASMALFGAQITASSAQQADQQQIGRSDHQSGEPKASGKRAQPASVPASPRNPASTDFVDSAPNSASSLAEGPQSSSGMRLMRYGRQTRVYGVH